MHVERRPVELDSRCFPFQTYAIHVRDVVRKTERDYKVSDQSNTVEYQLKGLEPGGRYSVSVRLRNMSKEASFTLSTGTLAPLTASEKKKTNPT